MSTAAKADMTEVFHIGDTRIDLRRSLVERGGETHELTSREVALLAYLADRRGQTVPQDQLLAEVWGYKPGVRSRAVAHAVGRLRRKLEADPAEPRLLVTVYGQGVRLELPLPVLADEAPAVALPALRGVPAPRPGLRGRSGALAELGGLWKEGAGLVTLRGTGGIGKTRLATEFAHHLSALHPPARGGVAWCDLSGATSADDLVQAVARGLGLPTGGLGVTGLAGRIGGALRARGRGLVVLDNFEQLDEDCVGVVGRWLGLAPRTTFLVTSRKALGLEREVVVPLPPLGAEEAVALLLQEARRVAPGFRTEGGEEALLERVVHQLDRLPLALELAGPRLPVLGASRLSRELAHHTRVLRGRGTEARHASMEAAITWSWALLGEAERQLLSQCAVFEGDFGLAELEAVAVVEGRWLPEVLEGLLAHSLLSEEAGRFRLLGTIRQAVGTLGRPGPEVEARHLAWALTAADAAVAAVLSPPPRDGGAAPVPEGDLLAAFQRALVTGQAGAALRLAVAIDLLQAGRIACTVRAARVDAALALPGGSLQERGEALRARGELARLEGEEDRALELLAAVAGSTPTPLLAARAALTLGALHHQAGRLGPAREAYTRALAGFEEAGQAAGMGMVHSNLGLLHDSERDVAGAIRHLEAAVAAMARTSLHRVHAVALVNLASLQNQLGRPGAAGTSARKALKLAVDTGLPEREAAARLTLGNLALVAGEGAAAVAHYAQAAATADSLGDHAQAALVRINQAAAAMSVDDLESAEDAVQSVLDDPEGPMRALALGSRGVLRRLQGHGAEAADSLEAAAALAEGSESWLVLVLAHLSAAQSGLGRLDGARRTLERATRLGEALDHAEGLAVVDLARAHLEVATGATGLARARHQRWAEDQRGNLRVAWRLLGRLLGQQAG